MPLLTFQNIVKRFNDVEVVHGVSFELDAGEVMGLIGENGSGKSTCMNVLGGVIPATRGTMTFDSHSYSPKSPRDASATGIAFVHQELNLFGNLSIAENVFIDQFPRRYRWTPFFDKPTVIRQTEELLEQVGLHQAPTTQVSQLSQGERQMVEIAKGLRAEAKLMIFDEPTTSLTKQECDRLFKIIQRLRDQGLGIIYISHILHDVLQLTDQIVVLRDGSVAVRKSTKDCSHDELVRHMVGRDINQLYPSRKPTGDFDLEQPILQVDGLSEPGFIEKVNLQIHAGEIVGIAGLMGSGRTELARLLFGLDAFSEGTVFVGGQLLRSLSPKQCADAGMAFVTEDRHAEGLFATNRIRPNVAVASLSEYSRGGIGLLNRRDLASAADASANLVGLAHEDPWGKLVRNLSGGNQQKVVLAKWLMRAPQVLMLDEPTRGVDIGAKHEIYETIIQLADAGSAVLMISSELEELMGLCDRILVMRRGEMTAEFNRTEFAVERLMQAATRTPEASRS